MRQQSGFTILEVMVSLWLLSIALLGMDIFQISAMKQAKAAFYFTLATQQLNAMIARLNVIKNDDYSQALILWNKQNALALPMGRGMIQGQYPLYNLTIFWGEGSSTVCQHNKIGLSGCLQFTLQLA